MLTGCDQTLVFPACHKFRVHVHMREATTCHERNQNQDQQQRRLAAPSTVIIEFRWLCLGSLDWPAGSFESNLNIRQGFRLELVPQAWLGISAPQMLGTVSWKRRDLNHVGSLRCGTKWECFYEWFLFYTRVDQKYSGGLRTLILELKGLEVRAGLVQCLQAEPRRETLRECQSLVTAAYRDQMINESLI